MPHATAEDREAYNARPEVKARAHVANNPLG